MNMRLQRVLVPISFLSEQSLYVDFSPLMVNIKWMQIIAFHLRVKMAILKPLVCQGLYQFSFCCVLDFRCSIFTSFPCHCFRLLRFSSMNYDS